MDKRAKLDLRSTNWLMSSKTFFAWNRFSWDFVTWSWKFFIGPTHVKLIVVCWNQSLKLLKHINRQSRDVQYSNGSRVFKWHWNTGPFGDRTTLDHHLWQCNMDRLYFSVPLCVTISFFVRSNNNFIIHLFLSLTYATIVLWSSMTFHSDPHFSHLYKMIGSIK